MQIATITPERHTEFLALVDAEIRPHRAKTHAWDDFPVVLSRDNAPWTLVATSPAGELAAGITCLIRDHETSCGRIPIAGIGSVVTHPDFRGRGLSRALQNALLARLRGKNVPLAVLWTDQPEIYAGRGFAAAGWETHVDLLDAGLPDACPPGFVVRRFGAGDTASVQSLYDRHALRTIRHDGDAAALYTMPGTQGLVAAGADDAVAAAVFCGKGADFPEYVAEWSGPLGLVLPLLGEARRRGWARHVLVPAGADRIVGPLVAAGAAARRQPAGWWAVVQPEQLGRYLQAAGVGAVPDMSDPAAVLGTVGPDGEAAPGPITTAVWGLDSV